MNAHRKRKYSSGLFPSAIFRHIFLLILSHTSSFFYIAAERSHSVSSIVYSGKANFIFARMCNIFRTLFLFLIPPVSGAIFERAEERDETNKASAT